MPGFCASVVPSWRVKFPALAVRLAAFMALVSHALAIVALCACSMAAPAGGVSSCHEPAEALIISSLDPCCCDGESGEARSRDFALNLGPDATSFQAAATSIVTLPSPLKSSETRLRIASHRGPLTPRPPLRV